MHELLTTNGQLTLLGCFIFLGCSLLAAFIRLINHKKYGENFNFYPDFTILISPLVAMCYLLSTISLNFKFKVTIFVVFASLYIILIRYVFLRYKSLPLIEIGNKYLLLNILIFVFIVAMYNILWP